MTDAASPTLRCPNCGAPAAAGAARCEYCHSTLATVSCPHCFKLLFDGAAFCPYCGTARSRVETGATTSLKCPACAAAMKWITVGTLDMLECTECDGSWIEAGSFERLCADRENQAAVLHGAGGAQGPAAAPVAPVRYRPCPRCGKLMNRVNFGRISGTVLDVCKGHGTFFDRGELHQVVDFILNGGLDRARQAERDALADEQRELRTLDAEQAMTGGLSVRSDKGFQDLLSALFGRRTL